jgi:lysozyme
MKRKDLIIVFAACFFVSAGQVQANVIETLKQWEGFSATPYADGKGRSIGYGHQIQPGENLERVTRDEAEAILCEDVKRFDAAVARLVTVKLTDGQRKALILFVFNIGEGAFKESTMRKMLNAGKYADAAKQFGRWVHCEGKVHAGLVERRKKERAIFEGSSK